MNIDDVVRFLSEQGSTLSDRELADVIRCLRAPLTSRGLTDASNYLARAAMCTHYSAYRYSERGE